MIEIKEKADCCGCYGCEQACPTNAIIMLRDAEGFAYPKVEASKCIGCGKCEKVCPILQPAEVSLKTDIFAAYRTDFDKRLKSQSGGIFAVLAEHVLQQNGIVCGAAFDDDWKLCHSFAQNERELAALLGSKYVQSEIGNAFAETKQYLEQGRMVLFSGTPCQVQGLKKFLGKEYDNLFTVDLICHGVPSPGVWEKYLKEFLACQKMDRFVQKNKQKNNSIEYHLNNGKVLEESYEENPYSKAFCKNLFLRPSCSACRFKGVERCSDISLGDFWGLEKHCPDFWDKYGISAVLLHTEKGNCLFDAVKHELKLRAATTEMLLEQNPCVMESVAASDRRDVFFSKWNSNGVIRTIEEIYYQPAWQRFRIHIQKKWEYLKELGRAVKRRLPF